MAILHWSMVRGETDGSEREEKKYDARKKKVVAAKRGR